MVKIWKDLYRVCIDFYCALGICAERNAILNLITNGEDRIKHVVAVKSNGEVGAPCGAQRVRQKTTRLNGWL